jgi:catechol 2,3-dioxygenase-like lactoylglutathione lyase family enzyme
MTKSTITRGVHHVGLTVPDIAATKRFFVEGQTGLRHLMCAIPGGVRLELVAEGG